MRTDEPHAINLADYLPPAFLIDEVFLEVELHPTDTRVMSKLTVRRNPAFPQGNAPLKLDGKLLKLDEIRIDGQTLGSNHYELGTESLTIPDMPDAFTLEISTRCSPETNTALTGLYLTEGIFCTQCEAEGFRRITYFIDRPDVMATYKTRIIAPEALAPVLLSNGNLIDSGKLADGRHFAEWHDPFPKPSYLFALVAGRLAHIEDRFTTASGREVTLRIFVEPGNENRCAYAMDALKRSFKWDEDRFGREYDLDIFMVVAVSAFNMGAMENKGLNVFNDKFVLASPDTATDFDYENIETIIAHEYFHNWTGNRITCRDWFQLCLKEGLTVFRDQEFTSDMRSRAVKRIADVRLLRATQFPEDQGPLAHPVRPDSYIEINNFYTATVYEKGAELCRMIYTLAGPERFRKGMDLYFERHDGEAATVEDFLSSLGDGAGLDLTQFKRWYTQAGTPDVFISTKYDENKKTFTVTLNQSSKPTPGQPQKLPYHIPFAIGLIGPDGKDLPLQFEGETTGSAPMRDPETRVLELTQASQTFVFTNIPAKPVPSFLRGFSAPVKLHVDLTEAERIFLMTHDSDPFNRWEAVQSYATRLMMDGTAAIRKGEAAPSPAALIAAYDTLLDLATEDPDFVALAIQLPTESAVAQEIGQDVDPDAIHAARRNLKEAISTALKTKLLDVHARMKQDGPFSPDAHSAAVRNLRNTVLSFLAVSPDGVELASAQFDTATNMTDEIAALGVLANSEGPLRQAALDRFYTKWQKDPLVIDKWLSIQSTAVLPDTLERVKELTRHPAFTMKNPNRMRAVIGSFAASNPVKFHDISGAGYAFVVDKLIELDPINPQATARLLNSFRTWRQFEPRRQALIEAEMKRVLATENLSKDSFEICTKILA